ncbi:hypothetical protein ACJJV6_11645 [Arthrobacter nitrophenolicus]|jgi:hypothetical protein|uniref:DoxX family protein n=2 Tax=Arthrobacter nitrophenolicus TaxID=683150 RepID=L8TQT1_9MICC|nr:hypothetical protein [Arthrobacter nitrophenolicus]ELT45047.1 hypothetical protein G205_07755 [Arthrobacter nitrophenolicus]TDL38061.1 hypothetical protein E2R57_10120 [Arthrobacter nitrophenolicus]
MKIKAPLVALQLLVGCFAVAGGWFMLAGAMELQQDWLQHTPFTNWTVPGIALLLLPGAGELLAATAVLVRWRYARAVAIFSGLGLVAWILVQLVWMQVFHPVMHPLVGAIGIIISVLAFMLPREAGVGSRRYTPGRVHPEPGS